MLERTNTIDDTIGINRLDTHAAAYRIQDSGSHLICFAIAPPSTVCICTGQSRKARARTIEASQVQDDKRLASKCLWHHSC